MNPAYGGGAGPAGQGMGQHSRFLDLLEQMRNEYSTLENENGRLMSIRQDFLRKVEENIAELQQMEQVRAYLFFYSLSLSFLYSLALLLPC